MKKIISLILAAIMLLGIMCTASYAEVMETVAFASAYGQSGTTNGSGLFIGAVGSEGADILAGSKTRAPYVAGITGNNSVTVGSARAGVIEFMIDGSANPEDMMCALLRVYVNSVNENLGNGWMLLGAYETNNPSLTYSVGGMDQSVFAPVNGDYSYEAAFWSKERCAASNLGWKTIDVTRAVQNALVADGGKSSRVRVVLRIQVPAAGLNISTGAPYAPQLAIYEADAASLLETIEFENQNNVLDSFYLPEKVYDTPITWKSSDPGIISAEPVKNGSYTIPAGYVTRQDSDAEVTLTATVSYGGETKSRDFKFNVKAIKEEEEKVAYVYAYFRGSVNGSAERLQIHLATSEDGLNWTDLNGNWPVIKSTMGTTGLRDPYIIRSRYGDKFYLIATDLNTHDGQGWTKWSMQGSKDLCVWESEDLVNWSEQRLVRFADENIGCAWAPESIYDETTGEYLVYASGKDLDAAKVVDTVYVSRTRDFRSFSEPEVFLGGNGINYIDSTIIKGHDGKFYRYSKENSNYIIMDVADTAHGPYTKFTNLKLGGKLASSMSRVEGPAIFRFNGTKDNYCLLIDDYGTGAGFTPYTTKNIAGGSFDKAVTKMPTGAKHGVIVPISQREYDAIMEKWGSRDVDKEGSDPILAYDFENETRGLYGNAKIVYDAERGSNVLELDGTEGTYMELHNNIFDRRDTFTLSMDVKNNMTSGNYFTFAVGKDTSYYYFFKDSATGLKSAITISSYNYEEKAEVTGMESTVSEWAHIDLVVEPKRMAIYKDGVLVAENNSVKRTISHLGTSGLKGWLGKSFFSADAYFNGSFDNVVLYNRALTADELKSKLADDETAVSEDPGHIKLTDDDNAVRANIDLPGVGYYGSRIVWETSNPDVVKADGTVIRPKAVDAVVTLKATFTKGEYENSGEYKVIVKAEGEKWESSADYNCHLFKSISGIVYINFDITASESTDGVIGICSSTVTPTIWGDYNITVRLNPEGYFDGYDAGGFSYIDRVAYIPGKTYHAVIAADTENKTYSFYISDGNAFYTVAKDFSFRNKTGSDFDKINIRGGSNVKAGLFAVEDFNAGYMPFYVMTEEDKGSTLEYTVANFGKDTDASFFTAKYLGDMLLSVKSDKQTVEALKKVTVEADKSVGENIKVFIWDDLKKPLAEHVEN